MSSDTIIETTRTVPDRSSSTAWFWWKESKQLAPLIMLLIIVAGLILIMNVISTAIVNPGGFWLPDEVVLLVFPGLFATGAGPLMVGQERSLRTMEWLALLPISAKRLLSTKLSVAFAGLALMWCVVAVGIALFGLGNPHDANWTIGQRPSHSDNPISYPIWMVHSIYVLLSGFYVSWRIRHTFYALILLIPLAFAPMIAVGLIAAYNDRPMMSGTYDVLIGVFTLLGIAVMAPLSYRAAMRALGPERAPAAVPLLELPRRSSADASVDETAPRFGTRVAALVWQSIESRRGMLVLLVAMLLVSLLAFIRLCSIDSRLRGIDQFLPFVTLLAPLAVCWLGTAVFKQDGAIEQIRFLADRGITPQTVYYARHAIPVAILATGLLLYAGWALTTVGGWDRDRTPVPSLITVAAVVFLFYSVSQWVSQLVRTLLLAVILGPIISVIVTVWLLTAYTQLALPTAALVIVSLLPLLATRVVMRRYMDATDRPLAFVVAAGVVAAMVIVPIVFAIAFVRGVPGMTAEQRNTLLAEAHSARRQTASPVQLMFLDWRSNAERTLVPDSQKDLIEKIRNSLNANSQDPRQWINGLETLRQGSFPLQGDFYALDRFQSAFVLHRMRWRQDNDAESFERFAPWLDTASVLLKGLRRSRQVAQQEIADRLEVTLIETLRTPEMRPHRDAPAVRSAVASIGTPASRAAARRRAVLASWVQRQDPQSRSSRDHVAALETMPRGLVAWLDEPLYESFVLAALDGIQASKNRSDDGSWRRRLHSLASPKGVFESSQYSDRFRQLPAAATMGENYFAGPGQLWGRAWEYVDVAEFLQAGDDTTSPAPGITSESAPSEPTATPGSQASEPEASNADPSGSADTLSLRDSIAANNQITPTEPIR
ncbi:acyltransferase [Roseiconus nitratireducens]|uniref:Acyltransferase n=1 Tax=Roseiconus nitratireducens TaxID=2605748 RepID=A0A5M6CXM5_9BACT|nr:acyltransferase [Roseiconus nitratireducens]KAA5538752.1 acyltransferase [Roseiconus nitratireducens]